MEIEKIQFKSGQKRVCEDYLIADETNGIFAVLDGATPVSDFVDVAGRNGAILASRIIGNALKEIGNTSIRSKVSEANGLLLKEMKKYQIDLTKKEELWSTCLAMVYFHENDIHFAQIGDCMIFALTKRGELEIVSTDMVFGISERAKQQRDKERLAGKNIPNEDFFNIKRNSLTYNRYLANKVNGYGVLNGDAEAEKYLKSGILSKEVYSEILLISDGLFPKDRNWSDMYYRIKEFGLHHYATGLLEFEKENRIHQDDKTGIFIKI